jgi:hypothetical protein
MNTSVKKNKGLHIGNVVGRTGTSTAKQPPGQNVAELKMYCRLPTMSKFGCYPVKSLVGSRFILFLPCSLTNIGGITTNVMPASADNIRDSARSVQALNTAIRMADQSMTSRLDKLPAFIDIMGSFLVIINF